MQQLLGLQTYFFCIYTAYGHNGFQHIITRSSSASGLARRGTLFGMVMLAVMLSNSNDCSNTHITLLPAVL